MADALSPREAQVLAMHDEGLKNKDIAEALGIGAGTVSNALTNGLRKAGRGHEVKTPTGSSGGKVGNVPTIDGFLASVDEALTRATTRVEALRTTAAMDASDIVNAHREALTARMEALQAEADGLGGNTNEAKANREALVKATQDKVNADLAEAEATYATMQAEAEATRSALEAIKATQAEATTQD